MSAHHIQGMADFARVPAAFAIRDAGPGINEHQKTKKVNMISLSVFSGAC
jgi:hypothetical protein